MRWQQRLQALKFFQRARKDSLIALFFHAADHVIQRVRKASLLQRLQCIWIWLHNVMQRVRKPSLLRQDIFIWLDIFQNDAELQIWFVASGLSSKQIKKQG